VTRDVGHLRGQAGSAAAVRPAARAGAAAPPGSGWPDDPASAQTPVATDAAEVAALAATAPTLAELAARQSVCRACPRLVDWRESVAAVKRRSFRADRYWGRPVPGWGDERPRVLVIGLAPAAHGGNRTGRIFTGDRSGDVLFASMWRCGLAARPDSRAAGDGQRLRGVRMAAAVRCAPPANKPTVAERDTCAPWLTAELDMVAGDLRVVVCLGHFAWQAAWKQMPAVGYATPSPRPAFGHGVEVVIDRAPAAEDRPSAGDLPAGRRWPAAPASPAGRPRLLLIGCYHPSQQNTFTGRVTDAMLDAVFARAREYAGLDTCG
jgi:uracil-DNA glycosylase family 4